MFGGGASLAAAQIQQQQAIPSVLSESGQSTKLTLAAIAYDIAVRAKREQFGDPEKAIIYQIFLREFDKLKDSFASCITIYPVGHRLAFLRRFESLCNNVSCTLHKSLKTGTIQGSNYKNLDTEQKDLFRELKTLTKIIEDKQTELLRKILAQAEAYQLANKQAAEKLAEASGGKTKIRAELTEGVKEPSKLENQAYQLYYGTSYPQKEVAAMMSKKHNRQFNQGWVSRAVKKVIAWRKANNLPDDVPDKAPQHKTINLEPNVIDMGARTDGRTTGDPRYRETSDSED